MRIGGAVRYVQKRKVLFFVIVLLIAAVLRLIVISGLGSLSDERKLIDEIMRLDWGQIPVHFYGHGWGENVVLGFMAWPFIMLGGTHALLTIRIIVLFANLLSIVLLYRIAAVLFNASIATIAFVFAALWPWNIIAGSIGFNVFLLPTLLLGAILFMLQSARVKKPWMLYVAASLLAVSLYTYAAAFIWVPLIIVASVISFKEKFLTKHHLLSLCLLIALGLPIAFFHLKSQFGWPPINNFLFLHYPPITQTRFNNISIVTLWHSPTAVSINYVMNYFLHYLFPYLAYNPFYAAVTDQNIYGFIHSGLGFLQDPLFYAWAPRNGLYLTSLAFLWDPILIVAGLYALVRRRMRPPYRSFVLLWLVLYPLGPSFINGDYVGFTTTRDIFGMPVLILLSACGLYAVCAVLRRHALSFLRGLRRS